MARVGCRMTSTQLREKSVAKKLGDIKVDDRKTFFQPFLCQGNGYSIPNQNKSPEQSKMSEAKTDKNANPMRNIVIDKLVLNICIGGETDRLTRAAKVLKELTGQEPVYSRARFTVRTFNIRRNQKISCHVTVRGAEAERITQLGLRVKDYELKDGNFSKTGNFGFGITEHIDLGLKYDPNVGIYGMDFYVVLARPGFRVSRKKAKKGRVGNAHRISTEEAKQWATQKFNLAIL
jgi:large subunit ribosomal protein L11e